VHFVSFYANYALFCVDVSSIGGRSIEDSIDLNQACPWFRAIRSPSELVDILQFAVRSNSEDRAAAVQAAVVEIAAIGSCSVEVTVATQNQRSLWVGTVTVAKLP